MTANKLSTRTRPMILVSLITFCWTLAAASTFAAWESENSRWYIAAIVFLVNGFLPLPALRYVNALDQRPERAREMLLGRMPARRKQLAFALLATLALLSSAVPLAVGLAANDTHRYVQSFGLLCTGVGFVLLYRRSTKEEREASDPR